MKKTPLMIIFMTFIFILAMIGPARAETQKSEKQIAPMEEMMGERHMMSMDTEIKEEGNWCPRGNSPMCYMMEKHVIATLDGGIVVSIGNKLYKYDRNMNFQKEVEIPVDIESMKKMMTNMKEIWMMNEKMEKHEEAIPKAPAETKTKE